jgi:hypothetical protein
MKKKSKADPVRLQRLRKTIINMRGKLHDLSIEVAAIERYGEIPDMFAKDYEIHLVANALDQVQKEVAQLERASS